MFRPVTKRRRMRVVIEQIRHEGPRSGVGHAHRSGIGACQEHPYSQVSYAAPERSFRPGRRSRSKVRERETRFSAMIGRSQVRSDGPGRGSDDRSSRHAARTTTPLPPMKTGRAMRSKTRVAAQAQIACGAPERTKYEHTMMSRTATATYAGRASSMRRLRRRATAAHADGRPFCRTNGCPSFLELDPSTGIATCPVCGATQRSRGGRPAH